MTSCDPAPTSIQCCGGNESGCAGAWTNPSHEHSERHGSFNSGGFKKLLKVVCLGIVMCATGTAHAAKVSLIGESLIPGFGGIHEKAAEIREVIHANKESAELYSAILTLNPEEEWVQALKQTIYIQRSKQGSYSISDDVEVIQARGVFRKRALDALKILGAENDSSIATFVYRDGNTFGDCSGLVFARARDLTSGIVDVTFAGSCYSE